LIEELKLLLHLESAGAARVESVRVCSNEGMSETLG